MTKTYDLVVLGSGPAGEKGAAQAAYFGRSVAMVERAPFLGGAAANTGTLTSKTLRETALWLSGFRSRDLYGVDLSLQRECRVRDFLHREKVVVGIERERIEANMARHAVDRYHGNGSFEDPHTIRVEREGGEPIFLKSEYVLIATGSSPRQPEQFRFEHNRVLDSDQVLNLEFLPQSLAVVGAGVVGSEYACTFAALGVDVILMDGREEYMGFLDRDVSTALKSGMISLGIDFRSPERVSGCETSETGAILDLESGGKVKVEAVLVASGRTSNTSTLNLEAAGITPGRRGIIEVDEHYCTEVSHIYAAGDVIGFPALASTSMEQARMAIVDAFQLGYKDEVAPILPFGIYTIPEVSMAGETEQSLEAAGIDYVSGIARYGDNARGVIIGDYDGFLKLIFRRDDMCLLGAHVIGEQAAELIHIGLVALTAGATNELFMRTCFNYPTLSDLYKYATYDAMGKRGKQLKN